MKQYLLIVLCMAALVTGCLLKSDDDFDIYFYDDPCIIPKQDYTYLTCAAINVVIDYGGRLVSLTIPAEFTTDLASIPRWLWPIIAPTRSDIMGAAILHDYLYSDHMGFTRSEIDEIFLQALLDSGTPMLRAYEMYLAVRVFGGLHFNQGHLS